MRTEVVGRSSFEITDSIREYAEKKTGRLTRYLDEVQQVTWTMGKESSSKDLFTVEVVVDVEHHPAFVSKSEGSDVYAVIDQTVDKASRQLTDHKEKLRSNR